MALNQKRAQWYLKRFSSSLIESSGKFKVRLNDGAHFYPEFAYLCPLCLKSMFVYLPKESLLSWTSDFTLDHLPPESVGGSDTVLVCKDCNSKAGSNYDYSIKEFLKHDALIKRKKNSKVNIKASFKGIPGSYNSGLSLTDKNELTFNVNTEKKPYVKEWLEEIKSNTNWELKATVTIPELNLVYKALLKSAYLFCFSVWGYSFIYSMTGSKIRGVLNNSENHILENLGVFISNSLELNANRLILIQNNSFYDGFVVNMTLLEKESNHKVMATILIPGNDSDSWENLSKFDPYLKNKASITFSGIEMVINYKSPINPNSYQKDWEDIKKGNIKKR